MIGAIARLRAEAWDEGAAAARENVARDAWGDGEHVTNPYRAHAGSAVAELATRRAKLDAATPGPWLVWDDGDIGTAYPVTNRRMQVVESQHIANTGGNDSDLIVDLVNELPALLDVLDGQAAPIPKCATSDELGKIIHDAAMLRPQGEAVFEEPTECMRLAEVVLTWRRDRGCTLS